MRRMEAEIVLGFTSEKIHLKGQGQPMVCRVGVILSEYWKSKRGLR